MNLSDDERAAIVVFKVEKTKETLRQAEGIAQLGYWNAVANRLYYACYYITSALLVHHKYSAQTHSGTIRLLGLHFVTKNLVSGELAKFYSKLFEMRQTGDYDDLYNLTEEDVRPLIERAQNYIWEIEKLLI